VSNAISLYPRRVGGAHSGHETGWWLKQALLDNSSPTVLLTPTQERVEHFQVAGENPKKAVKKSSGCYTFLSSI
jgi:hypothetical protein